MPDAVIMVGFMIQRSPDEPAFDGALPAEGMFANFYALPNSGDGQHFTVFWDGVVALVTTTILVPVTATAAPLDGRIDLLASWLDGEILVILHDHEGDRHSVLRIDDEALTNEIFSDRDPRTTFSYWYQLWLRSVAIEGI
ncbi:MAG: hypothetical protein ACYDEH_08480 [Acidimicrobiales bacterium]